jgi:hypothetical protein
MLGFSHDFQSQQLAKIDFGIADWSPPDLHLKIVTLILLLAFVSIAVHVGSLLGKVWELPSSPFTPYDFHRSVHSCL